MKLHFWDTLKNAGTGTSATFISTVRNLVAVFGAKTIHVDVIIIIRKMSFQALTTNFEKI